MMASAWYDDDGVGGSDNDEVGSGDDDGCSGDEFCDEVSGRRDDLGFNDAADEIDGDCNVRQWTGIDGFEDEELLKVPAGGLVAAWVEAKISWERYRKAALAVAKISWRRYGNDFTEFHG
ncbi:hypothetical protein F0562_022509 [Nyssa sinensis]|uniref:Uncharacterized protein n=1 Tax=Nyssa sinensis TaxID=561372 RepID=A0A5J5BT78_9ASTE|nr:hypothetical protein F0562_022509 [Nyssa sinensis]